MDKSGGFQDIRMMIPHPISTIEGYIDQFEKESTICMTVKVNSKVFFPNGSDYTVLAYSFRSNYLNLYGSIRQRAIDKLIDM